MRICVDLDGVIAQLRRPGQDYREVLPVPGAVERLQSLKSSGHHIIIYTARHMRTCAGDVGKVLAKVGAVTLEWLTRHNIPYDEIHFGKPWADVYIDDNAIRFNRWEDIAADGSDMPASSESRLCQ